MADQRQPTTPPQPICLTFDNGPEPDVTPAVLDTLARRGIITTFFTIGEKLRDPARRALAARAREEGHQVGNHTLTHGATPRPPRPKTHFTVDSGEERGQLRSAGPAGARQ